MKLFILGGVVLPVLVPLTAAAQPGATERVEALSTRAAAAPEPANGPEDWFTIGVVTTGTSAIGLHLQTDLIALGAWSIGIGGSLVDRGDAVMGTTVPEASGVAYLARTGALFGPLRLRAQLGIGGAVSANASTSSIMAGTDSFATTPLAEGALLLSVGLGDSFALVGGPLVQTDGSATSITGFVGLSHR